MPDAERQTAPVQEAMRFLGARGQSVRRDWSAKTIFAHVESFKKQLAAGMSILYDMVACAAQQAVHQPLFV